MKKLMKYRLTKMAAAGGTIVGLTGATVAIAALSTDLNVKEKMAVVAVSSLVTGCGAMTNIKATDKLAELYSEMDTNEKAASRTMDFFDYAIVNEALCD